MCCTGACVKGVEGEGGWQRYVGPHVQHTPHV